MLAIKEKKSKDKNSCAHAHEAGPAHLSVLLAAFLDDWGKTRIP